MSLLVEYTKNWNKARKIANSPWVQRQPKEVAEQIREFMRACGITISPQGSYDWTVVRFVLTFQECLILKGSGYDYEKYPLVVDGLAGEKTLTAMRRSAKAGYRVWEFLRWEEIANKGRRSPTATNAVIYTTRPTVLLFAMMRTAKGGPLVVASWYRSLRWNGLVGGAKRSQHMLGLAIDFPHHEKLDEQTLRLLIHTVSPEAGGGVGVIELWKWSGWRWSHRIKIIGPAHVDIRAKRARWVYKTAR